MENRYCKNCKYWYEVSSCWDYWRKDGCVYETFEKNEEVSQITGQSRGKHTMIDYNEANKNNNCPYYKRKWYLFWIK